MEDIRPILASSTQLILVSAEDMSSTEGMLTRLGRKDTRSAWQPVGDTFPVNLGRNGLAWGCGLYALPPDASPRKQEGDLKAPQGIFALGTAFGYAPESNISWPYLTVHEQLLGIDDPASVHYNTIVDSAQISRKDWNSAEQMLRADALYQWGLVVHHNYPSPEPGAGSCIFMHVWRGPHCGTEGCTTMQEHHIIELLQWLRPAAQPLLIQGTGDWISGLIL